MDTDIPRRAAYSYLRFSSLEQAKGDSFRRQFEMATRYAEQHNLDLDDSVSFHDLGVSAYRGANSETGQLGTLLEAVKTGLIPPGAVILVESLDRISRQSARKALRIIESIVELDVSIVTLSDGREYTLRSLDSDPLSLLMAILTFIRANEESAIKSSRVAAAWEAKRRRAPRTLITSRCPGWMRLSDDKTRFVLLPEQVTIIQRIFRMAVSGTSLCGITRELNSEGAPPLRSQGRQGKFWTVSSVKYILESSTVVGTLTPGSCRVLDGKLVKARLTPIEGYYPSIISKELFKKAQDALANRPAGPKGSGKQPTQNIIGHVTRCGYCDSGMVKAWGYTGRYLVCRNRYLRAGCPCENIWYHEVEASFLDVLRTRNSKNLGSDAHSSRVWCLQVKAVLECVSGIDRGELNRLIRKRCNAVKLYYDTGQMEIYWKNGSILKKPRAFTPAAQKSKRRTRVDSQRVGHVAASTARGTTTPA